MNNDTYTNEELSEILESLHIQSDNNSEEFWADKYVEVFGDRELLATILNNAGIQIPEEIVVCPKSWKAFFVERYLLLKRAETTEKAGMELSHDQVQELLKRFQAEQDMDLLVEACVKVLSILDFYPKSASCYHLLGFICYLNNSLHEASTLLQIGKAIDNTYEPISELQREIRNLYDEIEGDEGEQPLLEGNCLSNSLKCILEELFDRFDEDKDGALNVEEMDHFLYTTNGLHPAADFVEQLFQMFSSNEYGLTVQGFFEFFLQQALDNPLETRGDLKKHGYDPKTFTKISV
ncbi:hypothetical protein K493DRAFT_273303 [Basidiobolus meristosporus CBS 931.73]|uniref:EF-hand domain-containing protein n=1 Tax=Basidiobolus meristosporus CBS 931.73 TaxID=1314790 RepID=A0A1Y1ZBS1_9FUNG|nr:hypothetical protein K493DRAFT_273303 [Basidiobolus meristosporus CBS 931.73]|eukprot:ORY07718.1 hypothetical protein K493DRAFT_273303 [Basidiobolus meristosporus CBS 931.73]